MPPVLCAAKMEPGLALLVVGVLLLSETRLPDP